MKDGPVHPELDGGSYLSTYGLLSPWTLWLLARAPELVAVRPSDLRRGVDVPHCPDRFCGMPMVKRAGSYACYRHSEPIRLRDPLQSPEPRWMPGQPSALSLVGKEVDIIWSAEPDQPSGYLIVEAEKGTET